ncbi:type I restriction enzyme HsdR N-terminal domain-containing protein, partial [Candidatus Saccharibacteria bacterium]|nr:type I restriction enzyme HsdR N-terminal domain-containing protein [Candidatus Saccharibacteria bacterium]
MLDLVEAEVRQQIDRRLTAQGWVLEPSHPERDVFIERSVVRRLGTIQRRKLEELSPDYVFFSDSVPVAVLEAKKPNVSIERAFEQGADYAGRIGCDFVFACNGPTFKSLHTPTGEPMFLNNLEVTEPLPPARLRKFWRDNTNSVMTVPHQVIESRAQLIEVFEMLNNVLRQAGIRAGLERFT